MNDASSGGLLGKRQDLVQRDGLRRAVRGVGLGAALLALVALVGAIALPPFLSGWRLANLVQRLAPPICGSFRLAEVHIRRSALFDALFGRPVLVQIHGLSYFDLAGREILAADRAEAGVVLDRGTRQLALLNLKVKKGHWHLASDQRFCPKTAKPALTEAQATTLSPATKPARPPFRITIASARFDEFDLGFAFPWWSLNLASASFQGSLLIREDGAPQLAFDAQNLETRTGGELRIGRKGGSWSARLPFDRVRIRRVATAGDRPTDLDLEVTEAITGRSKLAGTARFHHVFSSGKRRGDQAGVTLDARWTDVGDGSKTLLQSLGLPAPPFDGTITANLKGKYGELQGDLTALGKNSRFDVHLRPPAPLRFQGTLDGWETTGVLPPTARALFAGTLSGSFAGSAVLARPITKSQVWLSKAALRLERRDARDWPGWLSLRLGEHPRDAGTDGFSLTVTEAAFLNGLLAIEDVRGALPLDRAFRTRVVKGTVGFRADFEGPPDNLRLEIRLPPDSNVTLANHRFRLPAKLRGRMVDGNQLISESIVLTQPEGGKVSAKGALTFDGDLRAEIGLERFAITFPLRLGPADVRLTEPLTGTVALRASKGGAITYRGTFGDRLSLRGTLLNRSPFWNVNASFHRLPLDATLSRSGNDISAFANGEVRASGRGDVSFRVELEKEKHDWTLAGAIANRTLAMTAKGPLLPAWFNQQVTPFRLAGELTLDLSLAGPQSAPTLSGTLTIARQLQIFRGADTPVAWISEGTLSIRNERLHITSLPVRLEGTTVELSGWIHPNRDAPLDSTFDLATSATADVAALGRHLPGVKRASGELRLNATATGTARNPVWTGEAEAIGLSLALHDSPIAFRRIDGRLEGQGRTLSTRSVRVALEPAGQLWIGSRERPAVVELTSLFPLRFGRMVLPVRGRDVAIPVALMGAQLRDVNFDLDLAVKMAGPARLAGRVLVDSAHYRKSARDRAPALLRSTQDPDTDRRLKTMDLDLVIDSGRGALSAHVPFFPDLSLTLKCHMNGTIRRPTVTGTARGDGLYSRLALFLYDTFTDNEIRRCGGQSR